MTDPQPAEPPKPDEEPSLAQEVADLVSEQVHPDEELRGFGKLPFNYALIALATATALSIALQVVLSVTIDDATPAETHLLATCDWITKSGVGAFFGLVLGKSTK